MQQELNAVPFVQFDFRCLCEWTSTYSAKDKIQDNRLHLSTVVGKGWASGRSTSFNIANDHPARPLFLLRAFGCWFVCANFAVKVLVLISCHCVSVCASVWVYVPVLCRSSWHQLKRDEKSCCAVKPPSRQAASLFVPECIASKMSDTKCLCKSFYCICTGISLLIEGNRARLSLLRTISNQTVDCC